MALIGIAAVLTALHTHLMWMFVLIIPVDLATLLLVDRLLRAEGRSLREMLLPVRPADLGWGMLMGLIALVGFFVCSFIAAAIVYQGPPPTSTFPAVPLWLGLLSVTVMPVTIGLAEEGLYRGYLQPRLAGRIGPIAGIVLASLAFGIQHIAFTMPGLQAMTAKVIETFLCGLMFAGLLYWRKRVLPVAVAHWFIDFLGLGVPMLVAALS